MADLTLLDGTVTALRTAAAELPKEDLQALLDAELAGKTRKGAVALLEELIAGSEPPAKEGDEEIENITPGTTLHLGDGRQIGFGERAIVVAGSMKLARERGHAR